MHFFSGGALLGDNTANTRHGTIFFEVMQTTSRACINGRMVDNTPCQADISGIITLSNNSEVVVTSPSIATIIVKDDDSKSRVALDAHTLSVLSSFLCCFCFFSHLCYIWQEYVYNQ